MFLFICFKKSINKIKNQLFCHSGPACGNFVLMYESVESDDILAFSGIYSVIFFNTKLRIYTSHKKKTLKKKMLNVIVQNNF